MNLTVKDLTFSYRDEPVLRGVTFDVKRTGVVGVVGPNAAGKSTLMKALFGQIVPSGRILVDGQPLEEMNSAQRRDTISYMPQSRLDQVQITVLESILLARLNRLGWSIPDSELDRAMKTLETLGIENLARRPLGELSGGQQQMVGIAQVLVRNPRLLLMDEPTAGLDLNHRLAILEQVREMTHEREMISFLVLHDLNLAARFADQIMVLNDGEMYRMGSPSDVLTQKTLRDVYDVEASINRDESIPHIRLKQALNEQSTTHKRNDNQ